MRRPASSSSGVAAGGLRLGGEVVGVHADAVPADQPRTKGLEVPLAAGSLQHGFRVEAKAIENHGELVHQGDVQVALDVLDHLGGFGGSNVRRGVRAGRDDAPIEGVHEGRGLRRGAGGDLHHVRQTVLLVAWVDAFRAVAGEEIAIADQPGLRLHQRHGHLFGRPLDRRWIRIPPHCRVGSLGRRGGWHPARRRDPGAFRRRWAWEPPPRRHRSRAARRCARGRRAASPRRSLPRRARGWRRVRLGVRRCGANRRRSRGWRSACRTPRQAAARRSRARERRRRCVLRERRGWQAVAGQPLA